MTPRNARNRRLMALHNAQLAGRRHAEAGGDRAGNPYRGKKLRGAVIGLYRAWEQGFDEAAADRPPTPPE